MRIIAGSAKGRLLTAPKTFLVRPVADKVKGAIFNILGDLEGLTALDLFSGSGSVGLEAVSRGASSVVFVDSLPQSLDCLRENIIRCGFKDQAIVMRGRIPQTLPRLKRFPPFHLVFVDPPYDKNLVNSSLAALSDNKLIDAQTRVIVEHSPRELPQALVSYEKFLERNAQKFLIRDLSSSAGLGWELTDQRKYGQTLISFLKLKNSSHS